MRTHFEDYGELKLDKEGNIRLDLPCAECDYNLRGLPARGECPECGSAIADSCRIHQHPIRQMLIPAAPLAGISLLLAVSSHYSTNWYSTVSVSAPNYPWIRLCQNLSAFMGVCSIIVFVITLLVFILKRRNLPMALALILTGFIALSLMNTH